ncbi:MAG: esterase, partial [Hydrococcus sp. SU_1_0]|nr:esterase [Hydrococcus sp. SU_1_0]
MMNEQLQKVIIEQHTISSKKLLRDVIVDIYLPNDINDYNGLPLLLANDGQDLVTMKFEDILEGLYTDGDIPALFVVGIHCAADRKNEYGTAKYLDYKGRGAKAALFNAFI